MVLSAVLAAALAVPRLTPFPIAPQDNLGLPPLRIIGKRALRPDDPVVEYDDEYYVDEPVVVESRQRPDNDRGKYTCILGSPFLKAESELQL